MFHGMTNDLFHSRKLMLNHRASYAVSPAQLVGLDVQQNVLASGLPEHSAVAKD